MMTSNWTPTIHKFNHRGNFSLLNLQVYCSEQSCFIDQFFFYPKGHLNVSFTIMLWREFIYNNLNDDAFSVLTKNWNKILSEIDIIFSSDLPGLEKFNRVKYKKQRTWLLWVKYDTSIFGLYQNLSHNSCQSEKIIKIRSKGNNNIELKVWANLNAIGIFSSRYFVSQLLSQRRMTKG